jgi:hypothetical protein
MLIALSPVIVEAVPKRRSTTSMASSGISIITVKRTFGRVQVITEVAARARVPSCVFWPSRLILQRRRV